MIGDYTRQGEKPLAFCMERKIKNMSLFTLFYDLKGKNKDNGAFEFEADFFCF